MLPLGSERSRASRLVRFARRAARVARSARAGRVFITMYIPSTQTTNATRASEPTVIITPLVSVPSARAVAVLRDERVFVDAGSARGRRASATVAVSFAMRLGEYNRHATRASGVRA